MLLFLCNLAFLLQQASGDGRASSCSAAANSIECLAGAHDYRGVSNETGKSSSLLQRGSVVTTAKRKVKQDPSGTLVAYWNFEDEPGTIDLEDVSGNGHSLTCTKYSKNRDYAQVAPGKGLQGTGALTFPDRSGTRSTLPLFRTVSFWIKRDAGCCNRISKLFTAWYFGGFVYLEMWVHFEKLNVRVYSPSGQQLQTTQKFLIATESTWTHLAVSLGDSHFKTFLDNQVAVSEQSSEWLHDASVGEDLTLQLGTGGPHHQVKGYVDDVRMYKEALSDDDIELLFEGAGAYSGANSPPFANAGDPQVLVMPVKSIKLAGICADSDGPQDVKATWTIVSQPEGSEAKVDDATKLETSVSFSSGEAEEGDFILALHCSDGKESRNSQVVVSVNYNSLKSLSTYWRFEEAEGMRTVTDDSGFGHTLTLRRWSFQHPWAEMEIGQGLAGSTGIRFFSRSSARAMVKPFRTLAFWAKRDAGCCVRITNWVRATRPSDGSEYFRLDVHAETLRAYVTTSSGTQVAAFMLFPAAEEAEDWLHVTVSIFRDRIVLFVNGEEVGWSTAIIGQLSDLGKEEVDLTLGTGGPHHPFLGELDEVRLYRGALEDTTVAALAGAKDLGGLMAGEVAPMRADAGPAQSIWKPNDGDGDNSIETELDGSCLGATGTPKIQWELASSPTSTDAVTIQDAASASEAISFVVAISFVPACPPGDYIFTLTCIDGNQSRAANVTVAIFEAHERKAGSMVRNDGQPANLPGVEGAPATPVGLWLFEGDLADSGTGGQTAQFYNVRGTKAVYEIVGDAKFGSGALHVRCEDSDCVQLALGNAESSEIPFPALSVSLWFKSHKWQKLAFLTKGSFKMDCPKMSETDADKWHHYVVVQDEHIHKAYFDGFLIWMENGGNNRTAADAADAMTFGIRSGHASYGFDGLIDDLAVFDYPLSNDEVEILRLNGAAELKKRPAGNPYNRGGYSLSMIEKYFQPPPEEPDYEDFFIPDPSKFSLPDPYVHPRLFFTPEELPEVRDRLKNVTAARVAMENLRSYVLDWFPFSQLAERNFTLEELMLPDGDSSTYVPQLMIMEAFRCLIDADRTMAVRLGQQLDSLAEEQITYLEVNLAAKKEWKIGNTKFDETDTWQHLTHDAVLRTATAFMYDLLYPYLKPTTRNKVRKVIALATQNTWAIGMDAMPAFKALTSNWVPWVTGDLALNLLAIEGEDGFDKGVYERVVKVFHGWTSLGISRISGASYEGGGKNALVGTKLLALAKHGHPQYMAAQGTRKFGQEFLLHTMLPNGKFFEEDLWGGCEVRPQSGDVAGLKFAFPDNEVIDYVYRRTLRGEVSGFMSHPREYHRLALARSRTYVYNNDILNVIYASDFFGSDDIEQHEKDATKGVPLTFVAKDVGLVVARSAWADKDAAWFVLDVRSQEGGHAAKARGTFLFYALGEMWAFYPTGHNQETSHHNVVLVDGSGQSSSPGKFLQVIDAPEATWGSSDLRYPYSFGQWRNETVNYFMLEKGPYKWMELQHKELPHWFRGVERSGSDDKLTGQFSDFRVAFRTGGLVRSGSVPYTLLLDDFQKDDSVHSYVWRMGLRPTKTVWDSVMYKGTPVHIDRSQIQPKGKDLILEGAESSARLLVRLLDGSSDAVLSLDDVTGDIPSVTMTTSSKAARFRVLLWPLREGAELPTTSWDSDINLLTIANPDGTTDELQLGVSPEGMTSVASMTAGGKSVTFTLNGVASSGVSLSTS